MLAGISRQTHSNCNAPQFSIQIRIARLPNILAMLRMVGYSPKVAGTEDAGGGVSKIILELTKDERVAEVLVAWIRTIPGVQAATVI
jgi:hypothetical protein